MKRILLLGMLSFFVFAAIAQNSVERPKIVVGIVVDQMRWDYLYRYYDRYDPNGGFKRLINQGFSCDNTLIPYSAAITACGHTSIYTGSVPAINGITGNTWFDYDSSKGVYCVADDYVTPVGTSSDNGKMSPRRLLTTTICDELRLATNFNNKVVGVALKDRGSILPAGHSATAAYWFDITTGNWVSSSYYMTGLPQWVTTVNEQKLSDKFYAEGWKTLYPIETYTQSSATASGGSKTAFGTGNSFPYKLSQYAGKNYSAIEATPFGNTITLEMAKATIQNEQMGTDSVTDFLAVSLSSPDYIGHTFGPNSIEAEDNYLRLDKDLADFLNYLDSKIGKNQYLVFLSADHGVTQPPSFMQSHKIPAGSYDPEKLTTDLNTLLQDRFKTPDLVVAIMNEQVFLNRPAIAKAKYTESDVCNVITSYLEKQPFVSRAIELKNAENATLNRTIKDKITNGYYPQRSGDVQIISKPQWIEGFATSGTTHGTWFPYDAHIPLIFYGWKIKQGKTSRETSMADIAPTLAALLHIQQPSGCIGKTIGEIAP
jgi:predicted AlkP superfamily pyrophosphatase or phosphodiesterase